jgi:hypothetical protein
MMGRNRELESHSYWPGYVDALVNIVLNLLFLVAIFVIGVAALGLLAARRVDPPPEVQLIQPEDPPIKRAAEKWIREFIVKGASSEPAKKPSTVSISVDQPTQGEGALRIRMEFDRSVFLLSKKEQDELIDSLSGISNFTNWNVSLVAFAPVDDALMQRASMNRLLSIRNVLLEKGLLSQRIQVRIDTQIMDRNSMNMVVIELKRD